MKLLTEISWTVKKAPRSPVCGDFQNSPCYFVIVACEEKMKWIVCSLGSLLAIDSRLVICGSPD